MNDTAKEAQSHYYARTGRRYDELQDDPTLAHANALGWLTSLIELHPIESVLDIGSGTGRVLLYLKGYAGLSVRGVEPSQSVREIATAKGVPDGRIVAGDALSLAYAGNSFDVVCAFGVLHHIADHRRAVSEMCRVARKAVFISDSNNFGQGSLIFRTAKQILHFVHLWKAVDFVKTGFKGYHYSEGDGVFYSYSLFDDVDIIRSKCPDTYYMSTRPSGSNFYRSAQTLGIFASRDI